MTKALANTLGVQEAMVTLKLKRKTGTLKRSIDTKYLIKASIEVLNGFSQEQIRASMSETSSFINDLNREIQSNGQLTMVQAISIGKPLVVGEHLGPSLSNVINNYK